MEFLRFVGRSPGMSASVSDRERPAGVSRRSFSNLAAFLFGVPLGVGVLAFIHLGPLRETEARRYVTHPAEAVEVLLFCCALSALLTKMLLSKAERATFGRDILPAWDGNPIPATDAADLLTRIRRMGRTWRNSLLARRVSAVLDFVRSRGSANDLDDQMRALADNDALALESSYALTRFITWAIPILGFLGTVLGITKAISGVTPQVLEHNLNQVTDGLAEAFDTTALGLALTMVTMFVSFLAERAEEGVLFAVDAYADEQLAHRFERSGVSGGGLIGEELRRGHQIMLRATEQLVQRQAEVWARSLAEAQQQWAGTGRKQQEAVMAALEQALERTLATHARRLAELEQHSARQGTALLERLAALADTMRQGAGQQQAALAELTRRVIAQTEALTRLDAGMSQLVRLEEVLSHNLNVLAGAGAFEQAVSSMTAAIHLLTTRLGAAPAAGVAARIGPRPEKAA
jgi:biopolymer transport protein ExbB/TolQ